MTSRDLLKAENERLKKTLRLLYSEPMEPGVWGIRCIEDHNSLIREALAESEEEILAGNGNGGME